MSHDLLVQMAYCLFKCGKRCVVVESLAGGFEPFRKGEMFLAIRPVLRPTIERRRSVGQRSFKLHTHTKKGNKRKDQHHHVNKSKTFTNAVSRDNYVMLCLKSWTATMSVTLNEDVLA